jgi:hypothetical protein
VKDEERRRRKLEAVAHHESGHAVACIQWERPFKYVTIIPGEDSLGAIHLPDFPKMVHHLDIEVSQQAERWINREVLIRMAGSASEGYFTGRHNWRGAAQDMDTASYFGDRLYPTGTKVHDKYLGFMFERAKAFITAPERWFLVEAVATRLLERRKLSSRAVREIIREAHTDPARIARLNELYRQDREDNDA